MLFGTHSGDSSDGESEVHHVVVEELWSGGHERTGRAALLVSEFRWSRATLSDEPVQTRTGYSRPVTYVLCYTDAACTMKSWNACSAPEMI